MKTRHITPVTRETGNAGDLPNHTGRSHIKLLFLFFSGTGNTQFIAEYLKNRVLECCRSDYSITLAALEWTHPDIIKDCDLLCLGYPVYEGRAPENVREFIKQLPVIRDKGVFVYNTKGMAEGTANWSVIRRLERKGFRSLGYCSQVMPASDGISMMLKKDSGTFLKYLARDFTHIEKADKLAAQICNVIRLLQEQRDIRSVPRRAPLKIGGFLTTGIFRLLYKTIGTAMVKKMRVTDQCTLCGLCVKQCPEQNIINDNHSIRFGNHCVFCLRCINNCPGEAVQVGNVSVNKARWHGPCSGYKPLLYKTPQVFVPGSN